MIWPFIVKLKIYASIQSFHLTRYLLWSCTIAYSNSTHRSGDITSRDTLIIHLDINDLNHQASRYQITSNIQDFLGTSVYFLYLYAYSFILSSAAFSPRRRNKTPPQSDPSHRHPQQLSAAVQLLSEPANLSLNIEHINL